MFGNKDQKIEKLVEKKNAAGLIALLNDKNVPLSLKAAEALGKVNSDEAYNMLITLMRSPMAEMRAVAIAALGEMGDQKARAHIDHNYATETDPMVQEAMREALSKLHTNE